ncbi:MAG: extracellular solute-binding protein, partial [Lachnospiraceae bacterium]|nr:extracellular solute-binding protein [Lachnospiraceae bacterium]
GNDMPVAIYYNKDLDDSESYTRYTMAAYLDMDKGTLGAGLDGIASGKDDIFSEFSVYSGGSDDTFLINDQISLSEYDISTGVEQVICNWMDCGLAGAYVLYAVKCGNGNIFCLYNDGDMTGASDHVIAGFVEKTDIVDDRPVVRVADCFENSGLQQAILKMNRENEKYRVEYVSYYRQNDATDEKLKYDIIAGNAPDVIILYDPGMDINNYIAKGFLEDLTPYIEKDSVLNEDYFLDGFLDAIRTDGKIYFLGNTFRIETLVGKKSELSEYENEWTMDAFMEYYKSKPEGTDIFSTTTKEEVCYTLIAQNMSRFIDWNTGRCTFDGEEFRKILEFCNGLENGEMDESSEYNDMSDHIKPIKEGKLLFQKALITSIQYIQPYQTVFGNDEMYIGYPSDSNNGTYLTMLEDMVGIFASSEHKNEAWDFIKALFESEYIKNSYDSSISSSKEGFEKHFQKQSGYDQYTIFGGISVSPARKEDAEAVKELVKKSTYRYYIFEQYEIIEEDINSYFAGEKGLDETVKIIQDRMDKYVNENR